MPDIAAFRRIMSRVLEERERQDAKFGQQDHRDACAMPYSDPGDIVLGLWAHGLPSAQEAQYRCRVAFDDGRGTWLHIAVEELAEAAEEAIRGDTDKLEGELIQTAAVILAWLECIERRKPQPPPATPEEGTIVASSATPLQRKEALRSPFRAATPAPVAGAKRPTTQPYVAVTENGQKGPFQASKGGQARGVATPAVRGTEDTFKRDLRASLGPPRPRTAPFTPQNT